MVDAIEVSGLDVKGAVTGLFEPPDPDAPRTGSAVERARELRLGDAFSVPSAEREGRPVPVAPDVPVNPAVIGPRIRGGRPVPGSQVRIGAINVHSNASDPKAVAKEVVDQVADEIERRQRDEGIRIESAVTADETTEGLY